MMILRLLFTLLLTLGLTANVWAAGTKFWVSLTGNNANACSAIDGDSDPGVYRLTLAGAISCLASGDILHVKAGTYTGAFRENAITIPNGTVGAYTVIEGEGIGITILSTNNIVLETQLYTLIQNLTVDGINSYVQGNADACISFGSSSGVGHHNTVRDVEVTHCHHGIFGRVDDIIIQRVHGHHVGGRNLPTFAAGELFYILGARALIEDGEWDHAGDGCPTCNAGSQIWELAGTGSANDFVVRRNKIHDNTGFGVALNGHNGQFYDNEVYSNDGVGVQLYRNNILVANNLIYNNTTAGILVGQFSVDTGNTGINNVLFGNNLAISVTANGSSMTQTYNACETAKSCGSTGKVNLTALTNITVSTSDFHHKAGSTGINAGNTVSTRSCSGVCDLGPYETSTYSTATINEAFVDVTIGANDSSLVPFVPTVAGWSVGCTGGANCGTPIVSNATALTGASSVVRLTVTGFGGAGVCEVGQTHTVSYSSATGATVDHRGQELTSFTTQAVINNCGTAPPATPGTPRITYNFNENTGTTAADGAAVEGGSEPGTLTNGPTWEAPGKHGASAVHFSNTGTDYVATTYGSGLDPSATSFANCMWFKPDNGQGSGGAYVFFGVTNGTDQRLYLSMGEGTYTQGVQGSSGVASNPEFPVTHSVYARICQRVNATTNIVTLAVNGVVGTSAPSNKAVTSYALQSNFNVGWHTGVGVKTGGTIDDFVHYTGLLSDADILADFLASEPPSPPAGCTLTQKRHQFMESHYVAGTTTTVPIGAQQASITKFAGESFAVATQTDATVAGCAIAQKLYYERNDSGVILPLTDDCNTPDQFCFVGTQTDPTDLLNETPATCLSGALTPITGSTEITAAAVPVTTFTTNSCYIHIRVLKLGVSAVATDTYDLFEYEQSGVPFAGTPDPVGGARVTVAGAAPGITAPTNLHFSGPVNSSLAALLWSPVTHSALAGYRIYRSTTSGVFDTVPTYTVTVAASIAAHSPPTQRLMVLPVAGTYYFVTKAYDVDGNESAATSEVSLTVTGQSARAARQ